MRLSVVIPTRNRALLLSKTLESITKQSLPVDQFEVLVIDNGSNDNTKEICDKYNFVFPGFKYLYTDAPGLHVGRHTGLKESNTDILVFADDDIEAFPTWLEGISEGFLDENVMLIGGKCLPKFEIPPPDWITDMWNEDKDHRRENGFLSIIDLGEEPKYTSPFNIFGCNFSIRKKVLIEAGAFHPDGFPDDMLKFRGDGETYVSKYIAEKKYITLYSPKASVYHYVNKNRMTIQYFCKRSYMQGISDSFSTIRANQLRVEFKIIARMFLEIVRIYRKRSINNSIRLSYWKGYIFHRNAVKRDRELYNWVVSENYL